MKVILVNGSPHEHGCTRRALEEAASAIRESGLETEFFWLGRKPVGGCIDCRVCKNRGGKCVFNDVVNVFQDKAATADGFIFGTPVYYGSANGSLTGFMDRLLYSCPDLETHFYHKPAAVITSARRSGTTAAFDQVNKYFTITQMPVISSRYWNMVHGETPEEVEQDTEGLYIMRTLGRNMAYFLKCKEAAAAAGIYPPQQELRPRTNFIR